jgi:hypothetical protein
LSRKITVGRRERRRTRHAHQPRLFLGVGVGIGIGIDSDVRSLVTEAHTSLVTEAHAFTRDSNPDPDADDLAAEQLWNATGNGPPPLRYGSMILLRIA